MRWLGASVHGALLAVALLAAYLSWKGGDEVAPPRVEEIPLWTSGAESAAGIDYRQGETHVRLRAAGDALPSVEVTEPARTPPAKARGAKDAKGAKDTKGAKGTKDAAPEATDGKVKVKTVAADAPAEGDADAAPDPPAPPQTSRFRGNKKAREALKRFVAPTAARSLGQPDSAKLAALGLDPVEATIEVDLGGERRTLEVGETTFGSPGRYVRLPGTGEVFVTKSDLASDLRWAKSRLKESDPFGESARDATQVTIAAGDLTRELTRLPDDEAADQPPDARKKPRRVKAQRWADVQRPEEEDGEATNWMAKLLRLRARKYVEAPADPGAPLLTVTFGAGAAGPGRVTLVKTGSGKAETYLLQSQYLESWLEVSAKLGEELASEVGGLFVSK